MSEAAHYLYDGFSPENIERIYRGEAALVNSRTADDALQDRQFEVLSAMADGLSYEEIGESMGLAMGTVKTHLHSAFGRLGIMCRSQAAGYFPLGPKHELVKDKKLGDIGPASLRTLQYLSVGTVYQRVAQEQHVEFSSIRNHMSDVGQKWPDAKGVLVSTRVSNAIRTRYVRAIEACPEATPRHLIGVLTLPDLSEAEPEILRLIASQNGNQPHDLET